MASLDQLSWRVWKAIVGGLKGSLALEVARFPKLFKRLTVRPGFDFDSDFEWV